MKMRALIVLGVSMAVTSSWSAETKKTRDEQVIDDRAALKTNDAWIYNDLAKGFEVARNVGKPLMVVYRCIP